MSTHFDPNDATDETDCRFYLKVIGRLELGGPRCAGAAQNHWN